MSYFPSFVDSLLGLFQPSLGISKHWKTLLFSAIAWSARFHWSWRIFPRWNCVISWVRTMYSIRLLQQHLSISLIGVLFFCFHVRWQLEHDWRQSGRVYLMEFPQESESRRFQCTLLLSHTALREDGKGVFSLQRPEEMLLAAVAGAPMGFFIYGTENASVRHLFTALADCKLGNVPHPHPSSSKARSKNTNRCCKSMFAH